MLSRLEPLSTQHEVPHPHLIDALHDCAGSDVCIEFCLCEGDVALYGDRLRAVVVDDLNARVDNTHRVAV